MLCLAAYSWSVARNASPAILYVVAQTCQWSFGPEFDCTNAFIWVVSLVVLLRSPGHLFLPQHWIGVRTCLKR